MYEVELKLPADHDALGPRLEAAGSFRGDVRQADTYYDAPHRSFAETDEALRLRRETREASTETRLTYKGPLVEVESKTRPEYETALENAEAAARILDALGYSPVATVEKERSLYAVEGYTVALDRVAGLGESLEVERDADEGSMTAVREGAYDVCRSLGLDPTDQLRTSYLGLLLDADGRPGDGATDPSGG